MKIKLSTYDDDYPLKVWACTIILSSLLQIVFVSFYHRVFDGPWQFICQWAMTLVITAMLTLPCFFLYHLSFLTLSKLHLSKFAVIVIADALAIAAFLGIEYYINSLLGLSIFFSKAFFWVINYSVCWVGSSLYFATRTTA